MVRILFCIFSVLALVVSNVFAKDEQNLEEIVVTATKTEASISDLPVTVQVVDRKEIDGQPNYYMSNFGELIRDLPGVHVAQYFPWGPPWVHLRGTGYFIGRTLYLVDGVPVTPFLSTTVNPQDIEKVEVLLGPSSALYGANAMGGVINLITKKGTKDTGLKVDMGYGSRNTFRPHVEFGNQAGGFHYYLSYSGDYSEGYKMNPFDVVWELYQKGQRQWLNYASLDNNNYRHSFYNGKIGWDNGKGTGLWFGYNRQDMFLDGGRPNRILQDDASEGVATLKFYTKVTDFLNVTATAGFQHLNRPGQENRGAAVSGGVVTWNDTPSTRSDWKQKRYPLELQGDIYIAKNSILTAGVSWVRDEEKRSVSNALTGVTTSKSEYTTDQTALYLQNQTFLLDNKLTVLAGIRYDHWKYHDIFDMLSTPQRPENITKDRVTYRGGLRYKLSDTVALRTSGGTGFWPGQALWFFQNTRSGINWREANPTLAPEKTWMIDLGVDVTLKDWAMTFSATPYYGRITDVVSYRYDPHPTQPGVSIIRTENLGGAKIYGLELSAERHINKNLNLFAALTLNHSEIVDDPSKSGNQLRNSPDYWGSLGLNYRNPDVVNGRFTVRFSDSRFYDDENTPLPYYHMRSYVTMDAKIWKDFKIAKNCVLTLSLSGDNLFDKKYETEIVYMSPGRTVMANATLKYNF